MTPYTGEDLAEGWEFKILRSVTGSFKKHERLKAALEEEARAGWVLVEKFDDGRVRLKRPTTAKEGDGNLDFDPYRTYVGMSSGKFGLLVTLLILGLSAFLVLVIVFVAR